MRGDVPFGGADWCESGNVFPACAGMFLADTDNGLGTHGFPRVRGDVPQKPITRTLEKAVFPACAGMFRGVQLAVGVARCFPRVRGDVPLIGPLLDLVVEFSPRARGCSVLP